MKIIIIPGDGIGPETMAVTTRILEAASSRFKLNLELTQEIANKTCLSANNECT